MNLDKSARLAVLIDGENIPAKYAKAIFQHAAKMGTLGIRRLYCDMQHPAQAPWQTEQTDLGLLPVHQPNSSSGKNASDIAMVIDAMDLLHSGQVDGFVLASSDGDFTRLAIRIREQGMSVVGIGENKAPEAFRKACGRFIELQPTTHPECSKTVSNADATTNQPLHRAYQLIRNATQDVGAPNNWLSLSEVGSQLNKRYPGFDPRHYGHKKLSDLIRETAQFEVTGQGASLRMRYKT